MDQISCRVLVFTPDPADGPRFEAELRQAGLDATCHTVTTWDEYVVGLAKSPGDLVLSDYHLAGKTGLDALHLLQASGQTPPFILVTEPLGEELAVACLRAGMTDYVPRSRLERLPAVVRSALAEHRQREADRQSLAVLQEAAERLTEFIETQQAVATASLDVDAVLRLAVDRAGRIPGADGVAAALREGDQAVFKAGRGTAAREVGLTVPIEGSLLKTCFVTGRVLHCDDADRDSAAGDAVCRALRLKSGIMVPLQDERAVFGVLAVTSERARRFTDRDVRTLQVVGNLLSSAVARATAFEALRDSERRYRRIIETAYEGICSTDQTLRVDYLNQRMAEMLDRKPEDVLGRNLLDLFHPGSRSDAEAHYAGVRHGAREQKELRFRRPDDEELPALVSTSAIRDDAGGFQGVLSMVTDLTTHRRLEEQFRQAQKMEAVGRLASGVAHDFNNLLTGISGYTDLLLMELPPEDPHRRDIEQIARAADRAAGLTGQLLAFSRRQITRPDVLDLNQILQELERMLKRLLGEDVEFATIPGENLGLIRADQGQLGQILMNLVVNSRDAMPQGGTLTIETANATLTARDLSGFPHLAPGSYVMLAVNDTGLGMTPQVRARIFEPFFTTKGVGQGTGLGLSTVYGIVQQNEGFVQVDSAPGAGTTIRIYFPQVPDAAVRNRHHVAGTAPRGGTETILVVEDEPDLRVLIRRILQRQGYSILEARHGRDALLQLRDHPGAVDLVLTDMVMPEMSGPDLIREALRVRASLRVLYMSGYIDAERVSRGLEQSALFVQKPFSAQQLAQRVREALDAPLPTAARSGASTPA